jgi:hypothetical protein
MQSDQKRNILKTLHKKGVVVKEIHALKRSQALYPETIGKTP